MRYIIDPLMISSLRSCKGEPLFRDNFNGVGKGEGLGFAAVKLASVTKFKIYFL